MTHHKCASSWLGQYLEAFCILNRLTYSSVYLSNRLPEPADVMVHKNVDYQFVVRHAPKGIHVIRNPFDLLCSSYYSHLTTHPAHDWHSLARQREILEAASKETGIALTIAFVEQLEFQPHAMGPFAALRKWNYEDPNYTTLRMEDVVLDVGAYLAPPLIQAFGQKVSLPKPEAFAFERFSGGRPTGVVDDRSHYRSGQTGQWRKDLPKSAIQYVQADFATLLATHYPEFAEAADTKGKGGSPA